MDKWGAVNTKLTKEGTSSRTTVAVCVLSGVLIASGLFVAGMYAAEPVIDGYLQTKQIVCLLYICMIFMILKSEKNKYQSISLVVV